MLVKYLLTRETIYISVTNNPNMVISTTGVWDKIADEIADGLVMEYDNATVYGDFEQDQILHEGKLCVLPNSWIVLPTGRLLSPEAVHHIDP